MSEIKMLGGLPGHERKGGEFQTGYSIYSPDGVSPTLLANGGGYGIMTVEIRQIGNLAEKQGGRKNPSCGRVYDTDGISPTLNTMQGGGREPHIVAMRGRNPGCPSSRKAGEKTEQRLEIKMDGTSNTITTVQKDNLVLEKDKIIKVGQISNDGSQCGTVVSEKGLFPTVCAGTHGYGNPHVCAEADKPKCINLYGKDGKETSFQERVYRSEKISPAVTSSFRPSYETSYRIRKLTPRECFRLMGVSDADAGKMLAVNSNSQCYKQAGNSIVVPVLEAIFRNLNIKGVKTWSEAKGDKRNV